MALWRVGTQRNNRYTEVDRWYIRIMRSEALLLRWMELEACARLTSHQTTTMSHHRHITTYHITSRHLASSRLTCSLAHSLTHSRTDTHTHTCTTPAHTHMRTRACAHTGYGQAFAGAMFRTHPGSAGEQTAAQVAVVVNGRVHCLTALVCDSIDSSEAG